MSRFEFGQRYRDADGDTYIVAEILGTGRHARLLGDFDILAHPGAFELDLVTTEHLRDLVRVGDDPQMTEILRARMADETDRAKAWGKVPSNEVRTVYNAAHDARMSERDVCAGRDADGMLAGIRDRALRKIANIVGDVDDAAVITGFPREDIERAVTRAAS
jgi:hypothetical protein